VCARSHSSRRRRASSVYWPRPGITSVTGRSRRPAPTRPRPAGTPGP
jgi:hypothetical protein